MMGVNWTSLISGFLGSLSGDEVIYYAVWLVLVFAGLCLSFQVVVSVGRVRSAGKNARLRLLEKTVGQGGVIGKKLLDSDDECWIRDYLLISSENDQEFMISMRNRRLLVRDLRGMLPSFRPSPLGFVPTMLTTL